MQFSGVHIQAQAIRQSSSSQDVEGLYEVSIPADQDRNALADIAIESFHRAIPIPSPEDFEITIIDTRSGEEIIPTYAEVGAVFDCKKIRAKPAPKLRGEGSSESRPSE